MYEKVVHQQKLDNGKLLLTLLLLQFIGKRFTQKKTKKNILIQNKYLIKLIVRLFKNKCLVFSLLYQTYKLKNKIVTKLFGRPKITLNGLKTRRWINRNVNHN